MPLALGVFAALIFIIAVKGNYPAAGQLFNQTFFGSASKSGFFTWAGSIFGLAIIFRIIRAPQAGELFIGLVMLVYFLQNTNVISQIDSAIQSAGSGTSSSSSSAGNGTVIPQSSSSPTGK